MSELTLPQEGPGKPLLNIHTLDAQLLYHKENILGRLTTAEVLPCSKEKFLGWRTCNVN